MSVRVVTVREVWDVTVREVRDVTVREVREVRFVRVVIWVVRVVRGVVVRGVVVRVVPMGVVGMRCVDMGIVGTVHVAQFPPMMLGFVRLGGLVF